MPRSTADEKTNRRERDSLTSELPVAVIVINYNGLQDTIRCIESLDSTTYRPLELYLVDNGSRNGEAGLLAKRFPSIRLFANATNLGFGAACNEAAAAALRDGAQYLLFLNNDTIVPPEMLRQLVETMRRDASPGICGPRVLGMQPPHRIQCVGYRYSNWTGVPIAVGKGAPADAPLRPGELAWIMGCTLLVSRRLWEETGGFARDFFLYWEDVFLCWQARRLGYSISIADTAVVYHRKRVGSEFSPRHVYHMYYGQVRFSLKTAAWYQWPTLTVGLIIVALGYAAFAYLRGRNNVAALLGRAAYDAFRSAPKRSVEF